MSEAKVPWSDRKKWAMGIAAALIVSAVLATASKITEPEPPKPKPCRHDSHGLEKYRYTDIVKESSGWLGGGKDQPWWCQQMKNKYQSTKPNVSIVWSDQKSSEQSRKSTFGKVTYKYHCQATASWDPIYKLKVSNACPK